MSFLNSIYKFLSGKKAEAPEIDIIKNWEEAGKPAPPPHLVKQLAITKVNQGFGYNLFIETGTYLGEMVEAQKNNFKKIYSIELSDDLYHSAVKKFEHDKHITILPGDSSDVLIDLGKEIKEPAIFWLDGHYSAGITARGKKECPIYEELTAILNLKPLPHILLIDDARLFVGQNDYPAVNELTEFIKAQRPLTEILVKDDIIHVYLK